jgi:hypothetical protein
MPRRTALQMFEAGFHVGNGVFTEVGQLGNEAAHRAV